MRISRQLVVIPMVLAALSGAPLSAVGGDSIEALTDTNFVYTQGDDDIVLAVGAIDSSGLPIPNPDVQWQGPSSLPMASLKLGDDPEYLEQGISYVFLRHSVGNGTYHVTASYGTSTVVFTIENRGVSDTPPEPAFILGNGAEADRPDGEVTGPGERFTNIAFLVQDSFRHPVGAGVAVTLTPPANGPSVTLDQVQLFTDEDGWVRTQGTATSVPGTYYLTAATTGPAVQGFLRMQNRPAGYAVGQQLADPLGADHAGQARTLRSLLGSGSYLLLDVCTAWCFPCHVAQRWAVDAKAQLLQMGIPLAFVPLLVDGPVLDAPSIQSDAAAWRDQHSIPDPVLHVSGQRHSEFWEAGNFVMGADQPAYPSYLLVGPDGIILERFVGARETAELVHIVSTHLPELNVADVVVNESAGSATVTVTRSRIGVGSTVNFTTITGTAGAADFVARSGVLSFGQDQATANVLVPIVNDGTDEPGETFSLSLSNATGAVIADGAGVISIADDDTPSVLTIDDVRAAEGTGPATPFTIPVRLDRPSGFSIVVSYTIVAGTATTKDVTLTAGTMTIPVGQTTANVTASVVADALAEPKETFNVVIKSATSATIADAQSLVTIVDDDLDTLAPRVAAKADVVVEVKMSTIATIVVSFTNPSATDNVDGTLATTCSPPSGSRFPYGRTIVKCTAEDRAGNVASAAFGVVVQVPTITGAVFAFDDTAGSPLTAVRPGQDVEVRVNAGAFAPRAKVQLSFIDATGRAYDLREGKAEDDGSLRLRTQVPGGVELGPGQMLAQSNRLTGDEYDRAWALMVVPR